MGPADKPGGDKRLNPVGAEPEVPVSLIGFALEVHRELSRHTSEPSCRAVIAACAAACGVAQSALEPDHLPMITAQIDRMFTVFGVHPDVKARCIDSVRAAARRAEHRHETVILILKEDDVITARNGGKDICHDLDFREVAYVKVATAISELARNILKYAGKGQITLRRLSGEREGIEVIATDQGPGIADVELVLSPKYRSKTGMGVGLRGSRRVMDHFEISSRVGAGTTVILRKYKD
jgi:serine/threonine-protein kinase RsbT